MATVLVTDQPSLVQEQASLEFVLPGEVCDETKESERIEGHLAVRHRALSFDVYNNDESMNESGTYCITVMEMSPENEEQNSTVGQRRHSLVSSEEQSVMCAENVPLTDNASDPELEVVDKMNDESPFPIRINDRKQVKSEYMQHVGIFRELAMSVEYEVRRALMGVVRNNKKAFKILGVSSL